MDSRAQALITDLGLTAHPEGGYFREIYRSPLLVQPQDRESPRNALTTIYFLLSSGDISHWHRVAADEVWHYYEGAPLELWIADASWQSHTRELLGTINLAADPAPCAPVKVVTAGQWQAARSTGAYTLVGCSVGPGFDFSDFELLRDLPESTIVQKHPILGQFV
jgi:predicted cupin superfamily sugar epimerase